MVTYLFYIYHKVVINLVNMTNNLVNLAFCMGIHTYVFIAIVVFSLQLTSSWLIIIAINTYVYRKIKI